VTAALLTGCRYGELAAMMVDDFNPDAATSRVRRAKSGNPRHVVLTQEGRDFFAQRAAGKPGSARLFLRGNGAGLGANPSNSDRSPRLVQRLVSIRPSTSTGCAIPTPAAWRCAACRSR
jgi:integrase